MNHNIQNIQSVPFERRQSVSHTYHSDLSSFYEQVSSVSERLDNSEWVLFDPSDDDVLSSSYSHSQEHETPAHFADVQESNFRMRLPAHDGLGLFSDLLTRCDNSSATLKDRIDEWQQDREEKMAQPLMLSSLLSAQFGSQRGRVRSLLNEGRKGHRYYGDYLFKGLDGEQVDRVKRVARSFSAYLEEEGSSAVKEASKEAREKAREEETSTNTMNNKPFLASNPFLRSLLLSTVFFNNRFFSQEREVSADFYETESSLDENWADQFESRSENFWENDARSVGSRLSVSSSSAWNEGMIL